MACAKVQPEVPAQPIRKRPRPTKLYIILGSVAYAGAAYFIFTEAAPQFIWFSLTCLALGAAVHSIRARSKRREIESRVRIAAFYLLMTATGLVMQLSGDLATVLGFLLFACIVGLIVWWLLRSPQPYGYFNPNPDE